MRIHPKPETKPEKTFTQEELDALITERLSRERRKYASAAELRRRLAELERREAERLRTQATERKRLEKERTEWLRHMRERDRLGREGLAAACEHLLQAEFLLSSVKASLLAEDSYPWPQNEAASCGGTGEADAEDWRGL
ncbi:hypothetical protein [Gorillibacterium sp. sgz500922]|uniref:hypothetical protein n=1 Tax=Gorillibacterium sp. sgz500922 TaxID=3446694 RepID=UPI003F67691B